MLIARIRLTAGPSSGTTTYARVSEFADGTVSYTPIVDPFEPGSAENVVRNCWSG